MRLSPWAERRPVVIDQLAEGGRPSQSVIDLSYLEAEGHFEGHFLEGTGTLLQVCNNQGERFIVLSDRAFHSLDPSQVAQLKRHGRLIHPDLSTIEAYGGGSARCLLAEVF